MFEFTFPRENVIDQKWGGPAGKGEVVLKSGGWNMRKCSFERLVLIYRHGENGLQFFLRIGTFPLQLGYTE